MKLETPRVPEEFLRTLPEGIKFIHRHEKEFLVIEEVTCPEGHSLMVDMVKIHGEPSIKIDVRIGEQKGSFFIDAFWGSHKKLYDFIPVVTEELNTISAFCPVCGTSLMTEDKCEQTNCKTKQHFFLTLPGGDNKILVCAKIGCPGHKIRITNIPNRLADTISGINYFGAQADDIFKGI